MDHRVVSAAAQGCHQLLLHSAATQRAQTHSLPQRRPSSPVRGPQRMRPTATGRGETWLNTSACPPLLRHARHVGQHAHGGGHVTADHTQPNHVLVTEAVAQSVETATETTETAVHTNAPNNRGSGGCRPDLCLARSERCGCRRWAGHDTSVPLALPRRRAPKRTTQGGRACACPHDALQSTPARQRLPH